MFTSIWRTVFGPSIFLLHRKEDKKKKKDLSFITIITLSKLSAARQEICPDKFYPTFDHNQKNFRCIYSFISNLNNRIESNPISLLTIFKHRRVTGIIGDD